jgi:phage terminase large subunit GpA-like protein
MLLNRAADTIEPRPRSRSLDWCRQHVFTHEGKPYDHSAYPHLGAPGGPMDAFDFAGYRSIALQWASRLGKSFFGQSMTMKTADCQPCPLMFASADQKLAVEVTDRTYRMLDYCPPLRGQLRPPHRRKQDLIDLASCRMFVGWARSTSTLADKAVRVGHANEIDKWEHQSTSKEADPLKLFSDRFKEFPSHKKIYESTPALKQSSRIERLRLASCNAAFYVPCPVCKRYQTLKMAQLTWEKNEAGKSTKDQARRTAKYACEHCEGEIRDEHRGPMMRAGVWVPEGCGVDDAKAAAMAKAWTEAGRQPWKGWSLSDWITGTPLRDGQDYGSQLSSLYALSLSWGDIAAEWVDVQRNPQNLRNFVNQWLAETWEIVSRKATWETVAARLTDREIRRGVVPLWASMVTISIDRQGQYGEGRHPWVVDAWGPGRRSATIAYGQADSLEKAELEVAQAVWAHADNGTPLKPSLVLIDSGNRPLGVYECCERLRAAGVPALPCKGSNNALNSDYDLVTLGKNSAREGASLLHVDTVRSQIWIDRAIHDADPNTEGGFALYNAPAYEHEDFCIQLLNDAPVEKTDGHNNSRESWDRIDTNVPNDFRDCKRYSYAAMLLATRHGPIMPRKHQPITQVTAQPSRIREMRIRR